MGYALRFFPPAKNHRQGVQAEPAIEYTYPQLLIHKLATRPGSILDRLSIQAALTVAKLHPCLIAYAALPDAEKEKDRVMWRQLIQFIQNAPQHSNRTASNL